MMRLLARLRARRRRDTVTIAQIRERLEVNDDYIDQVFAIRELVGLPRGEAGRP